MTIEKIVLSRKYKRFIFPPFSSEDKILLGSKNVSGKKNIVNVSMQE